ncbi:MAG: OsmC family protein [Solirubrobacterales bacterium]|nr:OsmC family protein [Solirubrobacterales bacterium]
MRAIARRVASTGFTHRVEIRQHQLVVDEPPGRGGRDEGPHPQELLAASLASCTAVTLEMYARAKGWDIGPVSVECEYATPERGQATDFKTVIRLPADCAAEQVQRLRLVARKCNVRRVLESEATFSERVELSEPAVI